MFISFEVVFQIRLILLYTFEVMEMYEHKTESYFH